MMAPMLSLRTGSTAARNAARRVAAGSGSGKSLLHPSIRAISTSRAIATNAGVQQHVPLEGYPGDLPLPPAVPQTPPPQDRRDAIKHARPFSEFLTDTYSREHDYLRISITERCNLRCLYCMPEEGIELSPSAHLLTTPEIFYLSSLFVSQGVSKIRLTGGEPTVRRDIVPLMQSIGTLRSKGLRELALTTNGISLHRKLDKMVEAGLTGINLSLDTLDPFQFQIMTRRKGFDAVMKSIERILELKRLGANLKLKVNCVVMRGLNERDIIPFVELGREKDIEVRFIEYMPFGGNKWSEGKMISFQEMLDIIWTKYPGMQRIPGHKNDTSKTFQVPGFVGKVGFITSMTNDFCGTCNRLRITSDGNLKVCLHGNAEVSLRDLLREDNGGQPIDQEAFERIRQMEIDRRDGRLSDETILGWGPRERALLDVIGVAVKRKAEKHADMGDLENMKNRPMILIDSNAPVKASSAAPNMLRNTSLNRIRRSTAPWSAPSGPRLPFLYPSLQHLPAAFASPFSSTSTNAWSRSNTPWKSGRASNNADTKLESKKRKADRFLDDILAGRAGMKRQGVGVGAGLWNEEYKKKLPKNKQAQYAMKKEFRAEKREVKNVAGMVAQGDEDLVDLDEEGRVSANTADKNIAGLLGDMEDAPTPRPVNVTLVTRVLKARIQALKERINLEVKYPIWRAPGSWDSFKDDTSGTIITRDVIRKIWRDRRKAAEALAKLKVKLDQEESTELVDFIDNSEEQHKTMVPAGYLKEIKRLEGEREEEISKLRLEHNQLQTRLAEFEDDYEEKEKKLSNLRNQRNRLEVLRSEKEAKMKDFKASSPLREEILKTLPREPRFPRSLAPTVPLERRDNSRRPSQTFEALPDADKHVAQGVKASSGPQETPVAPTDNLKEKIDQLLAKQAQLSERLQQLKDANSQTQAEKQREPVDNSLNVRSPNLKVESEPLVANRQKDAQMKEIVQSVNFLKNFSSRPESPDTPAAAMAAKAKSLLEELQNEIAHSRQKSSKEKAALQESTDTSAPARPFSIRFTNDSRNIVEVIGDPYYISPLLMTIDPKSSLIESLKKTAKDARALELADFEDVTLKAGTPDPFSVAPSRQPPSTRYSNLPAGTDNAFPNSVQTSERTWTPSSTADVAEQRSEAVAFRKAKGFSHPPEDMSPAETASARRANIFGESNKPDPIRPQWPNPKSTSYAERLESSNQTSRLDELLDFDDAPPEQTMTFSAPESTPFSTTPEEMHMETEHLRADIAPEGSVTLDEDLRVDFDASVPDLQSQLYNLQYRLQNAYPRIDTLPYNVWTSSNKRTLKMWLKILAGKWKTRFDNVDYKVDKELATVLDHMVQQHELSITAAKRMAQKFDTVFSTRGRFDGDAEGALDWEEFDAELGTWLRDEDANMEVTQEPVENAQTLSSAGNDDGVGKRQEQEPRQAVLGSLPFSWDAKPQSGLRRANASVSSRLFSTMTAGRLIRSPASTRPFTTSAARSGKEQPFKPGDWICPSSSCRNHNYAYRAKCQQCETCRPPNTLEQGKWICGPCNYVNYRVASCVACGTSKMQAAVVGTQDPSIKSSGEGVPKHFENDVLHDESFPSSRKLMSKRPQDNVSSGETKDTAGLFTAKGTSLPHLTPTGSAHMVSVSNKPSTHRTAIAAGHVLFSNAQTLTLIRGNALKKGDVLSVARIAGIMAAKRCPDLIPLCHPIAISHVGVALRLINADPDHDGPDRNEEGARVFGVALQATVECTGPTGVEMEALTSVMGAALTIVDMCKAVDKGMRIENVRVVLKEGGRSGTWREEGYHLVEDGDV